MIRTRIVFLPANPGDAPSQVVLGEGGSVLERGPPPPPGAPSGGPVRTVLVAPAIATTVRWLNLPTRNDAQARAAAALALEDELAGGCEGLHLALGPLEADGRRLVVAVDREMMAGWLDLAARHGLAPSAMIPDALLLPEPPEGEPLVAAEFAGGVAVRGHRTALGVDRDLAPLVLEGREFRALDPAEIEAALLAAAIRPSVNLLQDAFRPGRGDGLKPRDLRRAAVLALALLASLPVLSSVRAARLDASARAMDRRIEGAVGAVLPKGEPVSDPQGQVEARLVQARLAAGGGPTALAAQLFAAIEGIDQMQMESLVAMPDGAVRATVSCVNYSDIDVLRTALRRGGVSMREEGVSEVEGRVSGDVILEVRK